MQNEALADERIDYDVDEAADCLEDLRAAVDDCDVQDFFDAQGSHVLSIIGNGRPGILGDACDNVTGDQTCEPPAVEGEPCVQNEDCADGLRCDFDAVTGSTVCVGLAGEGEPCDQTSECEAGLQCLQDANFNNVCTVVGQPGSPCFQDADCGLGLICVDDPQSSSNRCAAPSGSGDPCTSATQREPGLDCRISDDGTRNICRGVSAEGQRCEATADCAPNLDCRVDDTGSFNICRVLSGDDEACVNDLDCAAGLTCSNTTFPATCQGPPGPGGACFSDDECGDLVCRFDPTAGQNVCAALADLDDACTTDNDCVLGAHCRDLAGEGTTFVCTDKLDLGAECNDDAECISGVCDSRGDFYTDQIKRDYDVCDGL
jgi:hypothetical protein